MQPRAERFATALADACRAAYGADLVTVALFGSWARGAATPVSDIDVLLVARREPTCRDWTRPTPRSWTASRRD